MSYYHIGKTNVYLTRGISVVLGDKAGERFQKSFEQPLRSETDQLYREKLKRQSIYQSKKVETRNPALVKTLSV